MEWLLSSIPQSNVRQRKEQERVTNQNQLHLDWLAVSLCEQKATFLERIKPAANQFLNDRSRDNHVTNLNHEDISDIFIHCPFHKIKRLICPFSFRNMLQQGDPVQKRE